MNELASFDASGEPADHLAHYNAVSRAKELDVGKCYGFSVETFSTKLLADLLASLGVSEKKKFVVTEPNGHFVITRMPDDYDLAVWRKNRFDKATKANTIDDQAEAVLKSIRHYITNPWDATKSYCVGLPKEMHSTNTVPYAYLQRKLACVAMFRNDRNGAKAALKDAIKRLCELGFISEMPLSEINERYKCKCAAYQVNMMKVVGNEAE